MASSSSTIFGARPSEGLVEHQQARRAHHRARHRHHLLLAAAHGASQLGARSQAGKFGAWYEPLARPRR